MLLSVAVFDFVYRLVKAYRRGIVARLVLMVTVVTVMVVLNGHLLRAVARRYGHTARSGSSSGGGGETWIDHGEWKGAKSREKAQHN